MKKINLKNLKDALSRDEMRSIKGGSGCTCNNTGGSCSCGGTCRWSSEIGGNICW